MVAWMMTQVISMVQWACGGLESKTGRYRGKDSEMELLWRSIMGEGNGDGVDAGGL